MANDVDERASLEREHGAVWLWPEQARELVWTLAQAMGGEEAAKRRASYAVLVGVALAALHHRNRRGR